MAIDYDTYNGPAYINVANCVAASGDPKRAKHLYTDGLLYDPSCIEGMYNLGLVNQHLKIYDEALEAFEKVIKFTPNNADAIYQMGKTFEKMGESEKAVSWYLKSLSIHQHDSGVLKSLAKIFDERGDKGQAYQYYTDVS